MKTTTIHKPRPTKNFTTFHNEMLQDTRLSYAALGILTMMLSKPWDWKTYVDWLSTQRRERKKEIQTCLKELESLGYLRRERMRGEKGKLSTMIWHWEGTPSDGFPSDGSSADGEVPTTKNRVYKAGDAGCSASDGREGTKKRKGGFVPQHTRSVVKRLPKYPQTVEEFEELLQTYGLDHDPDHDGNFWEEFTKRGWKMPDGSPVKDVGKLYESRLEHCMSY